MISIRIDAVKLTLFTVLVFSGGLQAENASYQQSLQQFVEDSAKQPSPFSAEDQAVMQRAGEALAKKLPSPGLKVGVKAPDFTLNDAFGKSVNLYQQLKLGPVILVFYRGAWCPFCNMHLHVLSKYKQEFAARHAQLIAITPQKPDKSAAQVDKDGFAFTILSDLDSRVMRDYQLFYEVDDKLIEVYKKHGLDIENFNGKGRTVLPVPGTLVIDQQGIVRAVRAETDYTQRMEPQAILQALEL